MDNLLSTTIEQCVRQHASLTPRKAAIVSNGSVLSYAELWERVERKAADLQASSLCQRQLNVFRTTADADFIITYLATHLAGGVAVPLESDCSEEKLHKIATTYHPSDLSAEDNSLEQIADVLFTTGTTGQQKGVMLSHRAILANADNLISAQGFTSETVFVICGPLNHIGCLSKTWPVLILGGTLIIADGMKDINSVLALFDYPSKQLATFMVPAAIRMMLLFGKEKLKSIGNKISFIETGGAAIPQTDMMELRALLPSTRLYNTYASTETGIICTYDFSRGECVAGCCGPVMRNSQVFITPEGKIACKGATLMSGYIDDKALTDSVMHDGRVVTSDIGELDSQGRLFIKGRTGDVINIGGYKVSAQEVENAAMSYPEIRECICVKAESEIFGTTIKLIYVAKPGCKIRKHDLAVFLNARLERHKLPQIYEETDAIKHTKNGKPDRKAYN